MQLQQIWFSKRIFHGLALRVHPPSIPRTYPVDEAYSLPSQVSSNLYQSALYLTIVEKSTATGLNHSTNRIFSPATSRNIYIEIQLSSDL